MKIKSLNLISYGKFNNFKIDLTDGLNIIYGKNESGKSTIMSFIRAMIFGFSGRSHNISNNDRKRFLPWGNTAMSGEITLSDDNHKTIKVFRESGRSQGLDTLEAIDGAGKKIKFDGESFVGIGEDAFIKTFYIKQLQAPMTGENQEIEKKLINLSYSGEEDVSYHGAAQALTEEIKKYKPLRGSGGLIEELKNKVADLNFEKIESEKFRQDSFEKSKRSTDLSLEIEKYRKELIELRKQKEEAQKIEQNDKTQEFKTKIENLKLSFEQATIKLKGLEDELVSLKIFEDDVDNIIYESLGDETQTEEKITVNNENLKKCAKKLKYFYILAIFTAIVGIFLNFSFILTIIFIFYIIKLTMKYKVIKTAIFELQAENLSVKEKNEKIKSQLKKYNSQSLQEYTQKRSSYLVIKSRYDDEKIRVKSLDEELAKTLNDYKMISDKMTQPQNTQKYSVAKIIETEKNVQRSLELAIEEKSNIDGYLSATQKGRNLNIIITEHEQIISEIDKAITEYKALLIAKETLDDVYSEISSDFTPKVSARASEILTEITGGAHSELSIDKEYEVTMSTGGIKPLGYFSSGTADQVYLAVRLAVSDILFGGNNPIILDDVFLQYDSVREDNTLKMLEKRAEGGQQIIIFSCRTIAVNGVNVIQL